jgi:hypothetical protein
MIKTISASVITCFMAVSSFGVAAGEKAPVSDKDREIREQVPGKLDGKSPQKMDNKYRDKAGPGLKKIVKSGLRKYPPASGLDKGWAEVQMRSMKISAGIWLHANAICVMWFFLKIKPEGRLSSIRIPR